MLPSHADFNPRESTVNHQAMSRTIEPTEFSVPPALARRVEKLARQERRTPAALLREMLRIYKRYRQQREREEDEAWVMKLIKEAQEEQKKNPMSPEELLQEFEASARYGAAQAKKLGVKPKDIDRIIHEHRQRHAT